MPTPKTLADIPQSPESKIVEQVFALLKADIFLKDIFATIRLLENPSRQGFSNLGVFTLALQPFSVKDDDRPSQRSVVRLGLMVSAFLPNEQAEEDSSLNGLDLGSYLRSILWGLAVNAPTPGVAYTFATTEFKQLSPLIGVAGATRILSYQAIFEYDLDPKRNDFTA